MAIASILTGLGIATGQRATSAPTAAVGSTRSGLVETGSHNASNPDAKNPDATDPDATDLDATDLGATDLDAKNPNATDLDAQNPEPRQRDADNGAIAGADRRRADAGALPRQVADRRVLGQAAAGRRAALAQDAAATLVPSRGPEDDSRARPRWMETGRFELPGVELGGVRSTGRSVGAAFLAQDGSAAEAARTDSGGGGGAEPEIRWFDGRPIRAVRMMSMRVTAYSPDAKSCGDSADGITASGYPVETNGGNLVAADPSLLPLGSLVSVPGYDGGDVVPVLDVGGAIKGHRLDVLFPTHERAMRWGVRELEVTVWEYADGKPSGFRRLRQPRRAG